MEKTTVQISKKTMERLKAFKRHNRESYDEILNTLMDEMSEGTFADLLPFAGAISKERAVEIEESIRETPQTIPETLRVILDTTFIIDLLKREPAALQLTKELQDTHISTTSITVFEVLQGAKDNELATIRTLFRQMTILPLGAGEAERGGLIQKHLKATGRSIDPEDCMIAGIALHHKKKIVTRNSKHFQNIPGVSVQTY